VIGSFWPRYLLKLPLLPSFSRPSARRIHLSAFRCSGDILTMTANLLIYKNNHVNLMRFHIVLALVYFFLCSLSAWLSFVDKYASIWLPIFCGGAVCVHLLLAYGSKNRLESSRRASELIGVLLMFGFPVGTLLGYFFLQCTIWHDPEEKH